MASHVSSRASTLAVAQTPAGVRVLLALGVENTLMLVLAATAEFGEIRHVGRYADDPLPRLVGEPSYFDARATKLGPTIYAVCLPWPGLPAGRVVLGCVTGGGRKPLMAADAQPYGGLAKSELRALLSPLRDMLAPAFAKVLPRGHALLTLLARTSTVLPADGKTSLPRGNFDGVIDGLAHGWVWNPAQPGRRYAVEVVHQGQVVGRGKADAYRVDLDAAGVGDGCHHFKLPLSYELFDGQEHEISVRLLGAHRPLPGSPMQVKFEHSSTNTLPLMPRAQALRQMEALAQHLRPGQPAVQAALRHAVAVASLAQETGQPDLARSGYEQLLSLLGPNALCHCRIAETWLLQQCPDAAHLAYEAALRCEPTNPIALQALAALQAPKIKPRSRRSKSRPGLTKTTGP